MKVQDIKKWVRNIRSNVRYLLKYDLAEKDNELLFRAKDEALEDIWYEFEEDREMFRTLNILDEWETFDLLEKEPKSFCRLGDGEIYLMQGIDQAFQKYDEELAERLQTLISEKRENMYIGINRAYFHSPAAFGERNRKFYRLYGTALRRFFIEKCHPDNTYIDAGFLGAYFRFTDEYPFEEHYRRLKNMFKGRKVLLVSGEGVFEKLEYSLFDETEDFRIIHGPSKHAYSKIDALIDEVVKSVDTSWTICIILGMAAKIMVAELTDRGYMAWDIGHAAKDYDAYMKKTPKNEEERKKFWDPD